MSDMSKVLSRRTGAWREENMKKSSAAPADPDSSAVELGLVPAKAPFYTPTGGHFNQETGDGYANGGLVIKPFRK